MVVRVLPVSAIKHSYLCPVFLNIYGDSYNDSCHYLLFLTVADVKFNTQDKTLIK